MVHVDKQAATVIPTASVKLRTKSNSQYAKHPSDELVMATMIKSGVTLIKLFTEMVNLVFRNFNIFSLGFNIAPTARVI